MGKPDRWKIIEQYQDLAEEIRRLVDSLQLVNLTPKVDISVQAANIERGAERLLGDVVDLEEYTWIDENSHDDD